MPGYKVYGIDCNSIITSLGAIHCITKEIGVNEPVFISHSAIRDNSLTGVQQVKAYIKTKSGVASAKVYWTTDTLAGYSQIPMTPSAGDTFTANIPAQIAPKTVYYYVSATSNSGRTVAKPLTAPTGYIKFRVMPPVGITSNTSEVTSYSLKQNYPNPFNPETKISYTLPQSEFVSLKVYDVNGREVSTLVNLYQTSGSYSVSFDASKLSSGAYFYRLQAGSYSEFKSMVLIK
ncbi:MAG: T9SS type A sorting domain-containing protein [Bacteroidetes bacterium]|nr:T9SS type A sorting domain-containing protein [Bacteroidota bacterium]